MSGIGRTNSGSTKYRRLPRQYQEVEYLQSSGTQGFKTGVIFDSTIRISVDFMWTALTYDTDIIGVEGGSYGFAILANVYEYNKNRLLIGSDTNRSNSSSSFVANTRYSLLVGMGSVGVLVYFNDQEWNYVGAHATSNYSLGLFCRNKSNTLVAFASCRIYSCVISKSGTVVRNFVPCYRKSDSVAGMYDLVNNVFYTNEGTGTFTVGSDVVYD